MSFIDADDYGLALKHLQISAELALREAQALRRYGYEPVEVVGSDSLVWRSPDGRLFATHHALVEVGEYEIIPERKEDRT